VLQVMRQRVRAGLSDGPRRTPRLWPAGSRPCFWRRRHRDHVKLAPSPTPLRTPGRKQNLLPIKIFVDPADGELLERGPGGAGAFSFEPVAAGPWARATWLARRGKPSARISWTS